MAKSRIPNLQCPACGSPCDQHRATTGKSQPDAEPKPQDLVICIVCHQPLVFTHSMKLRCLTTAEFLDLEPSLKTELLAAKHRLENLSN
jgi:hypothetical protein